MAFYNQQYGYQPYGQAMPDQLAQLRQAQQFQPMPIQPMTQPQTVQEPMIWVQGEAGMKAYYVSPGCTVVLWDSERYVFYIKSADQNGVPTSRTFDYSERSGTPSPVSVTNTNYVTRQEFDALAARINAMTQTAETEVHHAE